jgi:dienelactone hydrolase
MRSLIVVATLCALVFAGATSAIAAGGLGIVLLHGKTGTPNQFDKLAKALTDDGYIVATPEMCWSKARIFDEPFSKCLKDVDAAVAKLRGAGAEVVVVAGMSQGGMAALDYGVDHAGIAAIVAMAPAGDPPDLDKAPALAASIKSAIASVAAGKGDVSTDFNDVITGNVSLPVKATPLAFLSFHGPDSQIATMKRLSATVLPHLKVPVLWIAGTRDPSQNGTRTSFARIPKSPLSRYVDVDTDHVGTPDASPEVLATWLATLK